MPSKKPRSERVEYALQTLIQGNQRFSQGLRSIETMLSALRLKDLAEKGQNPFAIILACSDSRLPAEMVFDRGVGDLFVIRIAGNIVNDEILGSIEFAALQLKIPLCVVMGHSRCGAMVAAEETLGTGRVAPTEHMGRLLSHIEEPYREARAQVGKKRSISDSQGREALLSTLTHVNIRHSVRQILERSPVLSKLEAKGDFAVVGAYYDLHEGTIHFEDEAEAR